MMYPAENPYSSPQPVDPSSSPYPLPQAPGASYYPPQAASPAPNPYPIPGTYPQPSVGMQFNTPLSNPRAKRAMINGFISLALGLLTLFTLVGFAGVITGTFAIIYGFNGLSIARRLPNNVGRGQAITGIVLGFVAWLLVILSFLARSAAGA